jgi:hypothetical protein
LFKQYARDAFMADSFGGWLAGLAETLEKRGDSASTNTAAFGCRFQPKTNSAS